jgi:LacI family transcriptional regulator
MKRRSSDDAGSPARGPVTLHDVARAAGVSVATVSFVANGRLDVRMTDATRERVQRVIEELGYRPNALAKNLANGVSPFIGLVADAIATTPFAGQIIHGAQDEAWRHGYVLLVANTEGDQVVEARAIEMMREHQVQGILYSTWYHRAVDVPAGLDTARTVLVNCFAREGGMPAVVPDEVGGGRAATEMLLNAGHRRIAFLNTTSESPAREGRLRGYRDALDAAGVAWDPSLVLDVQPDQAGGFGAVPALLDSQVTAVFCHNDRVAMGLYDGLRDRGLRVPRDLAVVGFDNQEVISAHLRPGLSTVQLPHYELGVESVRLLLGDVTAPNGVLHVACPVVARDSI